MHSTACSGKRVDRRTRARITLGNWRKIKSLYKLLQAVSDQACEGRVGTNRKQHEDLEQERQEKDISRNIYVFIFSVGFVCPTRFLEKQLGGAAAGRSYISLISSSTKSRTQCPGKEGKHGRRAGKRMAEISREFSFIPGLSFILLKHATRGHTISAA